MDFEKNTNKKEDFEENKEEKLEESNEKALEDNTKASEETKKLIEEDAKKTSSLLEKLRSFLGVKKEKPILPPFKGGISMESIRELPSEPGSRMWQVEQKLGRKLNPGENERFARGDKDFEKWVESQTPEMDPSKIDESLRLDPSFYEQKK